MTWKRNIAPSRSDNYLVSAKRPYGNGEYIFPYVAFYNIDDGNWYKYDPFANNPGVKEPLNAIVIAWDEAIVTIN